MSNPPTDVLMRRILNHLARLDRKVDALADRPRILYATPEEILVAGPDGLYLTFPGRELNHAISWTNPDFDRGLRLTLARRLGPGDTYLDIGTNAGAIAAVAARRVGASGRVITVEPLPDMTAVIRRNLSVNMPLARHDHHEGVIGPVNDNGTVSFFRHGGDSRVSSLKVQASDDPPAAIDVPIIALADIWPQGDSPLLVKIDVEGAEVGVLRQLLDLSESETDRTIHVIFEFAPEHLARFGDGVGALGGLLTAHDIAPRRIDPRTAELSPPITALTEADAGNLYFALGAEDGEAT